MEPHGLEKFSDSEFITLLRFSCLSRPENRGKLVTACAVTNWILRNSLR